MDNDLTECVLWPKLSGSEGNFCSVFSLYVRPWSTKERERNGEVRLCGCERKMEQGKEWSVWYSEGVTLCWRLSQADLSWADTGLITPGQVMIWFLDMKIKPRNQLLGHCERGKRHHVGNKFATLCTSQWLPSVTSQSHHFLSRRLSVWAEEAAYTRVEALIMHGMVDCEMIDCETHDTYTLTLFLAFISKNSDMAAPTPAELKGIGMIYQKAKACVINTSLTGWIAKGDKPQVPLCIQIDVQ